MNLIHALLLGIIQGLTEFIPVSSTAHLLIGQKLLGLPSDNAMFAFLVLVQLGTLLSLVITFGRDLLGLVRAFFARPFSSAQNRLAWYILIASVPALIAGYLLKNAVEALFRTPLLEAAIRLLSAALLLALAEWLGGRGRQRHDLKAMNWLDALIVGLFQVLSVFPGASRSGATISGGMLRRFDRPSAARFAFLVSVPVMLAAGLYEMLDVLALPQLPTFWPSLLAGFAAAAVVGWLAIRWLLDYIGRHSLFVFAGYCTLLGAVTLTVHLLAG